MFWSTRSWMPCCIAEQQPERLVVHPARLHDIELRQAVVNQHQLEIIAHRLSTIKNANQIIILQNGQVENTGTHQQLLDGDALYRDMWEAHIGAQNWSAGSGKGGN